MLSRRGMRIKAMQVVYMIQQSSGLEKTAPDRLLKTSIQSAFNSFLYCIHFISQLALQVDLENHRRKNKYLPTEDDLQFSTNFFANKLIQFYNNNLFLQSKLRREKLISLLNEEIIPHIYSQLKEFPEYIEYTKLKEPELKQDKAILITIWNKFLSVNEIFDEHMEDVFSTWADDEFIAKGLLEDLFQAGIFHDVFNEKYFNFDLNEEETDFAQLLLKKTLEENQYLEDLIVPKLQNWEYDRISVIDGILLKMAISEFLYLPTIPPKVTINEYLDISKIYSTPKSKEFINGVLDKVMIDLNKDGKIIKTGRGLIG